MSTPNFLHPLPAKVAELLLAMIEAAERLKSMTVTCTQTIGMENGTRCHLVVSRKGAVTFVGLPWSGDSAIPHYAFGSDGNNHDYASVSEGSLSTYVVYCQRHHEEVPGSNPGSPTRILKKGTCGCPSSYLRTFDLYGVCWGDGEESSGNNSGFLAEEPVGSREAFHLLHSFQEPL